VAKTLLGLKVRYFGDYELQEEIGRGGMGVVYKARQTSLNRIVAVKMLLHGDFASEEFVKRFHAEAEAAASLQHPNIVAIHEVGRHEGLHYFSMDYVEGRNLAELVGDRPLPPERAARYVQAVAEAVHHAHQHGILHRDLKPSNILVDALGQPRITDFGLAKRLDDSQPSSLNPQLTLTGQVLGAPSYMPPEQAAGNRGQVGVTSDVYALGAVLYHLLTGRPPFLAETLAETLRQVQTREPVPPRQLNPGVPRDLETTCLRCLRKDPDRRYASAAALAEDLRRWRAGEAILARPLGFVEQTWRASRRHPTVATLATLALVGLPAAALFWPRPPPLRVPPGVTELIIISDNTEVPARLCATDPTGSFWHKFPIRSPVVDVSPDGQRLCFIRMEGTNGSSVWVSRLDGRGQRRIAAPAMEPQWLDDRTVIYQPTDHLSLWAVDVETRQARKLFDWSAITPRGHAGEPRASPDRKRLLCNPQNGARAPKADVFICDLDGRNARVVWEDAEDPANPESGTSDHHLLWLNNDAVAWCRHASPSNRVPDMAIVTCRVGDTNLQALTGWKGYNYPLAVSPDGRRLLYVTEDNPGLGQAELWTMNLDGTGKTNVPGLLKGRKFSTDFGIAARWVRIRR
jgi:serine/threonine protein kinase